MDEFTFHASALSDALSSPFPVDITLDLRSQNENCHGFVIELSKTFVMLQNLEGWHADGILILPRDRVQQWEQGPTQLAGAKILAFNNVVKSSPPEWVNLSSLPELLWSLKANGTIICLTISDYAEVGQVISVNKQSVVLKSIDNHGEWIETPVEVDLSDINYIQFGDEYTTVLSRYVAAKTIS